jgi:hypothetical protein
MVSARKQYPLTPTTDTVEETRRSGCIHVKKYGNNHSEATELSVMSWNETSHPFDTAEGVLRLIRAIYLDRGRGLVSISHHHMQEINP